MKKYLCFVGVDVSKSKLDATLLIATSEKQPKNVIVSNDEKRIDLLFKQMKKLKIAQEATLFLVSKELNFKL
jgi:hypothetical protein